MSFVVRAVLILAAAVSLAACAAKPIPYDRAAAGDIKTIGIVTPDLPDGPTAHVAATVGRNLGLVGAFIDAALQAERETKLKALLDGQGFNAADSFTTALAAAVQERGYAVKMVPVTRESRREFLATYPDAKAEGVDAYLDVYSASYGYLAAGIQDSAPYRPTMWLWARLVRASDQKVLMQDIVAYNPLNGTGGDFVTLSPDQAAAFTDFDAIQARPKDVVGGLHSAFASSADAIGVLLQ